jgi:hypothetical protein
VVAALLATSLTGACWVRDEWSRPTPGTGGREVALSPGSNVRSEMIGLWLPEPLQELANPEGRARIASDPEGLRRFLESRRGQDPICTVIVRGYQADGAHTDITFLRRPCEEPDHFWELWDALAAAIAEEKGADRDFFKSPVRISAGEAPEQSPPLDPAQSP